jgi:ankyrin repeat protein
LLAAGALVTKGKPLLFASSRSAIEQLAQAGAALNDTMSDGIPDEVGSTALMFRAEALDIDSVDLLVSLGADGTLLNAAGQSEPPPVRRRPFGLSYAAMAAWSSMA